jgi:protein AFG1
MLETMAKLEHLRRSRSSLVDQDTEYSLVWLAKDMIENSPILFLDEFQLPDRVAAKILSNLLTSFFQLGGVVIATSNRMPDELAKAAGMEFVPPPGRGGLVRNWLGLGAGNRGKGELYGGTSDYAGFLKVLKARCEIWDMEGGKDWRRREAEEDMIDMEELREDMVHGIHQVQDNSTPRSPERSYGHDFYNTSETAQENKDGVEKIQRNII